MSGILQVVRPFLFIGLAVVATAFAAIAVVTQPFVAPVTSSPPPVDPARLEAHVRRLSVDFYPRSHDRFRNIERAAHYIRDELAAAGATVSLQDVVVEESTYRNVVARFGPATGPLTVIGAHYDSHGDAGAGARHPLGYSPETHTPGADDNASGVAGLIELARLLARHPPARPVELVAYTLEEPPHFRTGHMGSAWHARALAGAGREVRLMLSLETIGYFSDQAGSQAYPLAGMSHLYSERGNFIALVGKLSDFALMRSVKAAMTGATDLPVYSINAPAMLQGIDFSDHLSYWNAGFPAIMVTDTAFMRNTNYHQPEDTWEKLDYRRMAKVVQSVHALTQQQ